jgi:hypothetical protein
MSYSNWYKRLSPKKQLLVHFALQWIYWFLTWALFKKLLPDEKPASILYLAIFATVQATVATLIYKWKLIRSIFKSKTDAKQ